MKRLTTFKDGKELQIPVYVKLKSVNRRPGSGTYFARKVIAGKPAFITALPEHDHKQAWEFINREVHERMNCTGVKVLSQRSGWPFLTDLCEIYLNGTMAQCNGAKLSTRQINVAALKKCCEHLGDFSKLRVDKLTKQVLWDFQERSVGDMKPGRIRNQKAGGCNSYIKKVRGMFGKRVRADFWEEKGIELPPNIYKLNEVKLLDAGSTKYVPPTAEEEAKWFKDISELKVKYPDSYAAFIMAYGAGFRANECRHARWDWLKEVNGSWFLHVTIGDDYAPKFNKERTVPISDHVVQELIDTKQAKRPSHNRIAFETDYIIQRGRQYQAFRKVSTWFKARGWQDNRVLHLFRKHFGSQVVTQTGSIYDAQTLLGHASYQTTELYYTAPLETPNFNVALPKGVLA